VSFRKRSRNAFFSNKPFIALLWNRLQISLHGWKGLHRKNINSLGALTMQISDVRQLPLTGRVTHNRLTKHIQFRLPAACCYDNRFAVTIYKCHSPTQLFCSSCYCGSVNLSDRYFPKETDVFRREPKFFEDIFVATPLSSIRNLFCLFCVRAARTWACAALQHYIWGRLKVLVKKMTSVFYSRSRPSGTWKKVRCLTYCWLSVCSDRKCELK